MSNQLKYGDTVTISDPENHLYGIEFTYLSDHPEFPDYVIAIIPGYDVNYFLGKKYIKHESTKERPQS
jgi:outer membrane protease